MRKQITNVVYKNKDGWHYGYIMGDTWYYGGLVGQTLVELSKVKFASDIPSIDIYQPLKKFLQNKRGMSPVYVEREEKAILEKFVIWEMYVKPVSTYLPDVSINKTICSDCTKACKSDNVTACGLMVKKPELSLVRQGYHLNG